MEQALKIAFQYWVNRGVEGRTQFLALGDVYHGDTIGSLSLGDGGVFSAVFDPLCFPVVRSPGYADPGWADKACAAITAHAGELAAVVLEPLVQGAAGILWPMPTTSAGWATRVEAPVHCSCATKSQRGSAGPARSSRPSSAGSDRSALPRQGDHGRLPRHVGYRLVGGVFDAFLGADLGPQTFYHGHSYGGNALAAAVALEHLNLVESWDVLANVRARAVQLADLLARRRRPIKP